MHGSHRHSCYSKMTIASSCGLPLRNASLRLKPFSCQGPRKALRNGQFKVYAKTMELSVQAEEGVAALKNTWEVPDGSELYTVSLRKPLGLVLAEQPGKIFVEKVTPGGKGEAAGIQQGDILRGTTARTKNVNQTEVDSLEARNKQQFFGGLVLMKTDDEKFDTVMAAIDSSKCASCDVHLVMQRSKQ